MSLKDYIINVDVTKNKNNNIKCKQYDNGVEVNLVFTKGDEFISLEGLVVEVFFQLPNKSVVSRVCKINNNMAMFVLDSEITSLDGKIDTEIVINEMTFEALTITVNPSFRKKAK